MRGNPILRAVLLVVALGLTSLLVAAVLSKIQPPSAESPVPPSTPTTSATFLVPTLLTITLSSPATSLTLTEPSGRVLTLPTEEGLELEYPAELTVSNNSWSAQLSLTWEDPTRPNFIRIDFEPQKLKSSHLLLNFHRNVTNHVVSTNFDPGARDQ